MNRPENIPETVDLIELERFATNDGPGIRTVVFLPGCPLHCPWCANPESQSASAQLLQFLGRCTACGACLQVCPRGARTGRPGEKPRLNRALCTACGQCAAVCPTGALCVSGERRRVAQIIGELLRDKDYYDASGGGVTFSGGEPFYRPAALLALLRAAKQAGLSTAVETCGAFSSALLRDAQGLIDHLLFDVKSADPARLRKVTGAVLAQTEENLLCAVQSGAAVTGRIPVIPGFNHNEREIRAIFALLVRCGVAQADLLPYHTLGKHKYAALGRPYFMEGVPMLTRQQLAPWQTLAAEYGIAAQIGG